MIQRIALFATREEIESYFGDSATLPSHFEAHYNIAPAHPVLVMQHSGGETGFVRVRWGMAGENRPETGHTIGIKDAAEGLERGDFHPCIIPISGFFLWKKSGKRSEYPFFIRPLNDSLMAVAGVVRDGTEGKPEGCAIVLTRSTPLVHPLSEQMPLPAARESVHDWLRGELTPEKLAAGMESSFSMAGMSVLRVGKLVNDPTVNSPKLIQPLPK